ncbi:C2 calcium-dependent domain-containing protein 4C [Esox lucius]|uniref:C2 calcium-dependent domain-containing protein 4C n=1 Tax=Esox lucius TaxID=8010 RepID=UPI0005772C06|nr:C2 calcium-dependent domain-containing protein 4C [Esox lucius]
MWFLGKIRESMDSIPLEIGHYAEKRKAEDLSAKASLSNKLHGNILTPDKIPEFCLPPRLYRRTVAPERAAAKPGALSQRFTSRDCGASALSSALHEQVDQMKLTKVSVLAQRAQKPLPFSAEGYGLAGMYESPNTRRKESLFHCRSVVYTLDRSFLKHSTTMALEENQWKTTQTGVGPRLTSKGPSEAGSAESDTPSSNDSSPLGSPLFSRCRPGFSLSIITALEAGSPGLRSASASRCPLGAEGACPCCVVDPRRRRGALSPVSSSCIEPCSSNPTEVSSLSPPVLFPLDVLHCQKRLQREHVLPLPGGSGRVRFSAEYTSSAPLLSTVRVRVVSVEGLMDRGDPGALHCSLSLSLSPGKLQKQNSATIKNCRNPMFNEDFFFTELSRDSLDVLRLRLKVSDKPSALRRGLVLGVVLTEPLAHLLHL